MGVGVSGWRLARAVSVAGQLGVVSGVGLDTLLARRLQLGDAGGHIRRALGHFPFPDAVRRILDRYFVAGGLGPGQRFRPAAAPSLRSSLASTQLAVAANFVEVTLAKEGHDGLIGVNYLEKLQMSNAAALYGAMLAGVDFVLMGAGVPAQIPALLDSLADGRPGALPVDVKGGGRSPAAVGVDPAAALGDTRRLPRPEFLAVVSSHVLAAFLARDPRTRPDGFVVEGPQAGGHNAPPRGPLRLDPEGQPVYGPRDVVDLEEMAALGLPFWLAGGRASPSSLSEALACGASGIQVGSIFALCEESDLDRSHKRAIVDLWREGTLRVRSDAAASPTGYPFQLAELPGTTAEDDVFAKRKRVCDVGYLRVPFVGDGGKVGYRCPAEPVEHYLRKGGRSGDTVGRRCLCNGLIAAIGLGQRRPGGTAEPAVVTIGQELTFLDHVAPAALDYTAGDAVGYLLGVNG